MHIGSILLGAFSMLFVELAILVGYALYKYNKR